MANLVTTDDLKAYALWLAGEPTDGTSSYDERVLQHMQTVYNTLVTGGTLGTRDIAISAGLYSHVVDIATTDWYWTRKQPPFALVTTPAMLGVSSGVTLNQGTQLGTVALTYGSPTITFSVAPSITVAGWRLKILQQQGGISTPPITVPRIEDHIANATTALLDTAWNQDTQTVSVFVLFQAEYAMPTDFARFSESPQVHGGGWGNSIGSGGSSASSKLAIGSYEQVSGLYPLTEYNQGPPTAAARLNTNVLMMNRWDTFSYRVEFSYVFNPPKLEIDIAQEPLVPLRFRQILSLGAAMFITQDKVDGRTDNLASEFREVLHHMGIEYRREQNAGSELSGRHLYRYKQYRRGMLRTTSGLPIW